MFQPKCLDQVNADWSMARQRAEFFGKNITAEKQADNQLALQQDCLKAAANICAEDWQDVLVKITMLKTEILDDIVGCDAPSVEIGLLTSIETDIRRISGDRNGTAAA